MTFMLRAALAIYFVSDLAMGEARRMAPRYFPTVAAGILMVIGAVVAVQGLAAESEPVEPGAFKPVLILLSVLRFGLLPRPFGFVLSPATIARKSDVWGKSG